MADTEAAPVVVDQPKAEPAAPAPAAEPAKPEAPARDPNKTYSQAEIDAITAKVRKNERYRTRKEIEAFYQGRESVSTQKPAQPAAEAPKAPEPPKREAYGTYEEYLRADAAFTAEQAADKRFAARDREQAETRQRETAQQRQQEFQSKVREKIPDIDALVESAGDRPIHTLAQEAIMESAFGPEILGELLQDAAKLDSLYKMSPTAAAREIGKMEARHEAAQKASPEPAPENPTPSATKEPSKAPAPIAPVAAPKGGGDATDLSRLVDKPEEWAKARNREIHKRRTGT